MDASGATRPPASDRCTGYLPEVDDSLIYRLPEYDGVKIPLTEPGRSDSTPWLIPASRQYLREDVQLPRQTLWRDTYARGQNLVGELTVPTSYPPLSWTDVGVYTHYN